MMANTQDEQTLRVLITVKTYPIPSDTYDELVCTAGATENGDFVRLYPINFRDLPYIQKYKKYQWIEVKAAKYGSRDRRKESYRPVDGSHIKLGESLNTKYNWSERKKYVLKKQAKSIEDLRERQNVDQTSLGIFKPKAINDLVISSDEPQWKPKYLAALKQRRLWETRQASGTPLRKVPFKFHYHFDCDDPRCNGHKMSIHDWEVGALFWRCVDSGDSHQSAATKVKDKFLSDICGPDKETYFYVGTVHGHPRSWIVLGAFYPSAEHNPQLPLI